MQVDDDKDSAGLGLFHRGVHLVEECLLLRRLDMAQVVLQEVDIGLLVDALVAAPAVHALLAWHKVVAAVDERPFIAAVNQAIFLAELPADSLFALPAAFPVEDGDGRPVVELCAAQGFECAVHFGTRSPGKESQVEDRVERLAFLQGRDDIVTDDAAGWLDVVRVVSEHVRLAVLLGMVAAYTGLIRVLRLIALTQRLHCLAHADGFCIAEASVWHNGRAIRLLEDAVKNIVLHHTFHEAGPLSFFSSCFFSVDMSIVEEKQRAFVSKNL